MASAAMTRAGGRHGQRADPPARHGDFPQLRRSRLDRGRRSADEGRPRLSNEAYGLAVSAFFWIYVPVQLFAGWLCDRFSVYRLLAFGIVLWAASTLLMGFVGGFASLFVLRIMLGVGESLAFPGSSKIIARHVPPERRGIANAAVAMGIAFGPAVGTLAGGLMVAHWGWRAMFIVFGALTCCGCCLGAAGPLAAHRRPRR